jgi:hypothetical protein
MNTKQRFDFDPILEKISHHIPDEEINLLFPFKKFNTQGRSREFKTSTPMPQAPMGTVRILNIKLKLARSNSTIISRIRANDCLFHQGQHTFSRDYSKVNDFSCFLVENSI